MDVNFAFLLVLIMLLYQRTKLLNRTRNNKQLMQWQFQLENLFGNLRLNWNRSAPHKPRRH